MTPFQTFRTLYKSDFQACIEDIDWKRVCTLLDSDDDMMALNVIYDHMHDRLNKLDAWLMDRSAMPLQQTMQGFISQQEARLGPLSDRKKAELLYDNFSQVESVKHGLELLKLIERAAA